MEDKGDWTTAAARITDAAAMDAVRRVLDCEGPAIVEHRRFRGGRAPTRLVFDDFQDFATYVAEQATPGDSFFVWSYEELCVPGRAVAVGKIPDPSGRVPVGGAY